MVQVDDNGRRIGSHMTYLDTYILSNQQVLIMEIGGSSSE